VIAWHLVTFYLLIVISLSRLMHKCTILDDDFDDDDDDDDADDYDDECY